MASRNNRRRARRARINIDRTTTSGAADAPVTIGIAAGTGGPDHPAWLVAQDLPWVKAS